MRNFISLTASIALVLFLAGCASQSDDLLTYRSSAKVQAACAHYKNASYDLKGAAKLGALDGYENCITLKVEEWKKEAESSSTKCVAASAVGGFFTLGIAWLAIPFC